MPRLEISSSNVLKFLKGVPRPHSPSRSYAAKCATSLAPVAEQYTTRALGRSRCSSITVRLTLVEPSSSLPPWKFLALWASSKAMTPSTVALAMTF